MTTIFLCHCGCGFATPDELLAHTTDPTRVLHRHYPQGQVDLSDNDGRNLYGLHLSPPTESTTP